MKIPGTQLQFEKSTLIAVPSVHYSVLFAAEVRRRCYEENNPIDAVAVELGDSFAQAALRCIGDHCGTPQNPQSIPVMLGLLKRNMRIRASRKEEAFKLQRETGSELIDIPPEVLYERLGFSGQHVLYLSPTDSIIEAIRCSWERNLPLYGIDLDEMADDLRHPCMIPDPWLMEADIHRYVDKNQDLAKQNFDSDTDPRRELAMAARLRALLAQHRRVLFVCGLGHWMRIRELLLDSHFRPAKLKNFKNPEGGEEIHRVVVHPGLAVAALDLWPALIQFYEARRTVITKPDNTIEITRYEVRKLLRKLLRKTYRKHWVSKKTAPPNPQRARELETLGIFERYLQNLCLIGGKCLPDLNVLLKGAQAVMTPAFVEQLGEVLMDFSWADSRDFPYPTLMPPEGSDGCIKCTLRGGKKIPGSKSFCLKDQLTKERAGDYMRDPLLSEIARKKETRVVGFQRHTWGPWDYLTSGLSLQALEMIRGKSITNVREKFEGGHLCRVDIKSTLRSFIRGDEDLFVIDSIKHRSDEPLQVTEFDPVVWILTDSPDLRSRWSVYSVSMESISKYAKDPNAFSALQARLSDTMVCFIGYGPRLNVMKQRVKHKLIGGQKLEGFILYQPICWKLAQFAHWAESTAFKKNPFGDTASQIFDALPSSLKKLSGLGPMQDWRTALIVMAINFAKTRVAFVATEDYDPPSEVVNEARARGIELCRIPPNSFDPAYIERLRWNYLTPLEQLEPDFVYPKWVEKAIGESQYLYRDQMPKEWLHFGETLQAL